MPRISVSGKTGGPCQLSRALRCSILGHLDAGPDDVLRAVAAVLQARAVESLDDLTTSGRATVVRLSVTGGEVPTAILKLGGDHVLANRCGLAFLNAVSPGSGPLLLGAGDDFVVMEDLGSGPSLTTALASGDPAAAEAALLAHMRPRWAGWQAPPGGACPNTHGLSANWASRPSCWNHRRPRPCW